MSLQQICYNFLKPNVHQFEGPFQNRFNYSFDPKMLSFLQIELVSSEPRMLNAALGTKASFADRDCEKNLSFKRTGTLTDRS
ncbi:MAG: hypothetical protein BM558_12745 [Roseobacter sp. MedPE-SW]|nr:MAG: hypothetical protein BM558_12745 [Roseobacter sp. MedPE-SW]